MASLMVPRYKRLSFLSSAQRKKVEESLDGLIDEMTLKKLQKNIYIQMYE
jgi:hypothetical protein